MLNKTARRWEMKRENRDIGTYERSFLSDSEKKKEMKSFTFFGK